MFCSYDPIYQCYSSARLTWWIYMCHLVLASLILLGTSLTEDLASQSFPSANQLNFFIVSMFRVLLTIFSCVQTETIFSGCGSCAKLHLCLRCNEAGSRTMNSMNCANSCLLARMFHEQRLGLSIDPSPMLLPSSHSVSSTFNQSTYNFHQIFGQAISTLLFSLFSRFLDLEMLVCDFF